MLNNGRSGTLAPQQAGSFASQGATTAIAIILPPIVFRCMLLWEHELPPNVADLRGLSGDFLVAMALVLVVGLVGRFSRCGAAAFALTWAGICYGNLEHVRALGANASIDYITYLRDPTFRRGSLLEFQTPGLFASIAMVSSALAFAGASRTRSRLDARLILPVAGVAAAVHLLSPKNIAVYDWRQANFVLSNVIRGLGSVKETSAGHLVNAPAADLSGLPIVELGHAGTNVLLIIIESISGAYITPIAATHDRLPAHHMPNLSELATNALTWTWFFAQQRQTNRGEFALLCGEFPKLDSSTPRMTAISSGASQGCLPAVLRERGYTTVYLQAAPLAFMMKDQFMARIGFQRIMGASNFDASKRFSQWGVDDGTFYQRALEEIDGLERENAPWFMTLLTVGTHHPYTVPASFAGQAPDAFSRAVEFADHTIGKFIKHLKERGVLDRTLVLITSDESAGIEDGDDLCRILSQNWGFLIALIPKGKARLMQNPAMQVDLPLTVVDYLGVYHPGRRFIGRSLLRTYKDSRDVIFANTYHQLAGGVARNGMLYLCHEDLDDCRKFSLAGGSPFSSAPRPYSSFDPTELNFLRDAAAAAGSATGTSHGKLRLIDSDVMPLPRTESGRQVIFGGQQFSVPAGVRIGVSLDVEVTSGSGWTTLMHHLSSPDAPAMYRRTHIQELRPGDRFILHYEYLTNQALAGIDNRLHATRINGDCLELTIHEATMTFAPYPVMARAPQPILNVHKFQVLRNQRKLTRKGSPTPAALSPENGRYTRDGKVF